MAVYTYTGRLTDFRGAPFPDASPRLWVQPAGDAFTVTGPAAAKRVPVTVSASGEFSVALTASVDLTPPTGYTLRCEWLDADVVVGWADWTFTAQPGGGPIATMPSGVTRVWYAATPPPVNRAGIYWVHPVSGDVKEWI